MPAASSPTCAVKSANVAGQVALAPLLGPLLRYGWPGTLQQDVTRGRQSDGLEVGVQGGGGGPVKMGASLQLDRRLVTATTGRLVFPLAGARHLLDIKLGHVPYEAVTEEIAHLLRTVEAAVARSTLPDEPDREAAEDLVLQAYRRQVLAG